MDLDIFSVNMMVAGQRPIHLSYREEYFSSIEGTGQAGEKEQPGGDCDENSRQNEDQDGKADENHACGQNRCRYTACRLRDMVCT